VVDKPAGVLCVPDKAGNPSLAAAVFEAFGCESGNVDTMVAHRLGFDTTGLVVFARTDKAISNLNVQLRSRKVTKTYEALVCGTVEGDSGTVDLPLARDIQALPYVRVYTQDSQNQLIAVLSQLPDDHSARKFLKNKKPSITEYKVIAQEDLGGNAVTRLALTSVSGRFVTTIRNEKANYMPLFFFSCSYISCHTFLSYTLLSFFQTEHTSLMYTVLRLDTLLLEIPSMVLEEMPHLMGDWLMIC
jgi:hypothetical protein